MREYCDELTCFAFVPCAHSAAQTSEWLRSQLESCAPSLSLASSIDQGRYVVVKEGVPSVSSQEVLMSACVPYAYGLDPKLVLSTCSVCFSVSEQPFARSCGSCHASAWCSSQCEEQEKQQHPIICEPLRRLLEKQPAFPDSASLTVRALVHNLTHPLSMYALMDGGEDYLLSKKVYAENLMNSLSKDFLLYTNASVELIMRILCISALSSFGIYDGRFARDMADCRRGLALYPMLSFFNHCCVPNAVFTRSSERGGLLVIALEKISPGQAVTLRYGGPLDDDAEIRRAHLLEKYGFWCQCLRCQHDADCRMQADCPCLCGGIAFRDPMSQTIVCSRRCAPSMQNTLGISP